MDEHSGFTGHIFVKITEQESVKQLSATLLNLIIVFENRTDTRFACIRVVLGQPASLSKEVCLYTSADWLKCTCQLESAWREISSCTRAGNQMIVYLSSGYEELGYCF